MARRRMGVAGEMFPYFKPNFGALEHYLAQVVTTRVTTRPFIPRA